MNVFTIPATVSFVDALAKGLLERAGNDPLKLAAMTVLVPNRRAARSLRDAFLRNSNGVALLLPAIRPIGDVDEDALALSPGFDTFDNRVPVNALRRQLVLARYLTKAQFASFGGETFTMAQALSMAADLARFLDAVHTEGLTLDKLDNLVPDAYATHWQEVLSFLKQVLRIFWPRQLEAEDALDPGAYRNAMIAAYTQSLIDNPPATPIIAAGSTGSIPVTADLLKAVAELPQGCVVLPGLDQKLDHDSWTQIDEGHPQAGLAALLLKFGVTRGDVKPWDATQSQPREDLISTLMRPAATIGAWTAQPVSSQAFDDLHLIEADTLDAEAGAIAAIMRNHAQDTAANEPCVLVTPDRVLAGRVAEYLKRWNITVDDSAGQPLNNTPVGAWLLLLADTLHEELAPIPLLGLLKHPLAAGGKDWPKEAPPYRTFIRMLDMHVLRGPRPAPGFNGLHDRVNELDKPLRDDMREGLRALEKLFAPVVIAQTAIERLRALMLLAENLAASNDHTGAQRLWAGEAGESAATVVASLLEQADVFPEHLDWAGIAAVLEAAMQGTSVRPRFGTHPRLAILGPIEARLYQARTMILGGLNEGAWPKLADVDGWMSRPMRRDFGLPPPERAITLSAHDFCQGLGAQCVYITRSKNRDGAPTVPSRWIQRLKAVCAAANARDITIGGHAWIDIARRLDAPDGPATPVGRPEFNPPISARPKSLRVTEISQLRRDPYSIYARHVLNLTALDPIDADPDARERGNLVHKALETYTSQFPKDLPKDAAKQLVEIGKKIFDDARQHPDVTGHWWPRFQRMARALITYEGTWRENMIACWPEVKGEMQIGDFTLRGRADRIEHRRDGWAIIDYKSGGTPAQGAVKSGDEPQLTLLGAMLLAGAFNQTLKIHANPPSIEALAYWPAGGNKDVLAPMTISGDLNQMAEDARAGLETIIRAYLEDGIPYVCWPDPERPIRDDDDYAHLGRIAEWSGAEGEDAA
jgi:ATP-dependent helicase/nuclease subunit B